MLLILVIIMIPLGLSQGPPPSNNESCNSGGPPEINIVVCKGLETQPPSLSVYGTEYSFNDSGKTFLQVIDNGEYVTNASCTIDIWFPNTTTKFIDNQVMIQHDQGLQFIPFIVPEVEGVYMIAAQCVYIVDHLHVFDPEGLESVDVVLIDGTAFGDPFNLNDRDGLYVRIDSLGGGGTKRILVNHTFVSDELANATNVILQYMLASDSDPFMNVTFLNLTTNEFQVIATRTLSSTFAASNFGTVLEYLSMEIPVESIEIVNGTTGVLKIRTEFDRSGPFSVWEDWFTLRVSTTTNQTVNNLRGSGELHVTNNINESTDRILEVFLMAGEFISFTLIIIGSAILLIFFDKVMALWISFFGWVVSLAGFSFLGQQFIVIACAVFGLMSLLKLLVVYANADPKDVAIMKQ